MHASLFGLSPDSVFKTSKHFPAIYWPRAFNDYLATVGRSTPATEKEWGGRYWWPHARIIDRLNDYVSFLLEFPTRVGLESLTAIPSLVLKEWHIQPEQYDVQIQLMSRAQAEQWQGVVRRFVSTPLPVITTAGAE